MIIINNIINNFKKGVSFIHPIALFSANSKIQPRLYTPGPLLVSSRVKQATNFDYSSRDPEFMKIIQKIRNDLLDLAYTTPKTYQTVLIQGGGTLGVEAVIGCAIPRKKHRLLIVSNGTFGQRITKMAKLLNINHSVLRYNDNQIVNPEDIKAYLRQNPDVTHVTIIHLETTSGLVNPIKEVGQAIKTINPKIEYIVDAVSSFGAYYLPIEDWNIDYLISTSNKCLQGIPGFSFVLANKEKLIKTENNARSLSLDIYEQWKSLELNSQFRFTPPTHVLKAFSVALDELKNGGGIEERYRRYCENQKTLSNGMSKLGFKPYIDQKYQGCVVTTFYQPCHENYNFQEMYDHLQNKHLLIYPGKLTEGQSFRIGSIGELYPDDMRIITDEIQSYLETKQIPLPIN